MLHNGFLDLLFVYHAFVGPLPPTLSLFVNAVVDVFPKIIGKRFLFPFPAAIVVLCGYDVLWLRFGSCVVVFLTRCAVVVVIGRFRYKVCLRFCCDGASFVPSVPVSKTVR